MCIYICVYDWASSSLLVLTTEKNSSKEKKKWSEEGQTMATAAEKPLMVVGEKANRGETIDGES